ncbi:sugar phosphate isomerase/epimerase family protein [Pseudogulbenkiania ferrooxidans]|uniref:Xylose isomerase domain protein TIM barrel n=1 Tax=Pseudogulbenkiania ferrooxidans 2002 TaxID=279714 RepID=B9Z2U2_9NEIS|nr:sugar phosphate isomerase/epimerase family protein [Pseudogulbenkiania ferrooxidans]EEG08895.1 Xylose isomerase domain protein TIM barrel [Pseudogulbenkiania ferrooxidans 2002]
MERSRFAIDTTALAGALEDKLTAIAEAGFSAVTLSAKDLVGEQTGGLEQAVRRVRDSQLAVSGFLALRDFEGLGGRFLDYKVDIAKSMLRMAQQTGADLLLVSSTTSPQASGDLDTIVQHLQLLSALATPLGLRIGYEPLAWGRHVADYPSAWQVIERVDRENVGLVLDSFHLFARGMQPDDLKAIPPERLFLVQLSDAMYDYVPALDEMVELSLHHRFFPGEGEHSRALVELVGRLEAGGYRGRYAFEVANDDYQHCPPSLVLQRAGQAVEWLSSQLLSG